jgi:hypothetical protein
MMICRGTRDGAQGSTALGEALGDYGPPVKNGPAQQL